MSNRANRNAEIERENRLAALVAREVATAIQTTLAANPPPAAAANPAPHYSIKTFTSCNPPKYTGSDGATALLQWFEGIESSFSISECPEPLQVRYAASLFSKRALTWWNKEKNTRGMAAAHAMPWADVKALMLAEFCPRNEIKKLEAEFWDLKQHGGNNTEYTNRFHELSLLVPRMVSTEAAAVEKYLDGLPPKIRDNVLSSQPASLENAIRLAASLTDNLVKDGDLVRTSKNKREKKADNKTEVESGKKGNKRRKGSNAKNFAASAPKPNNNQIAPPQLPPPQPHYHQPQIQLPQNQPQQPQPNQAPRARNYTGPFPFCPICTYHHLPSAACWRCTTCGRLGHLAAKCHAIPALAPPPMNQQAPRQAGNQNQYAQAPQQPPARGRAFQLNGNDAQVNNDVVNGFQV